MRILLIDDEDMVRDLFRSILTDAGYEVADAANGVEALKLLERESFDLIITDILMPEKEGVETIHEIRHRGLKTRIIAISGGGRVRNFAPLDIAGKLGADLTLPKPIGPDELLYAVRAVMSGNPANPGT